MLGDETGPEHQDIAHGGMPRGKAFATANRAWLPPVLIGLGTTKQIRLHRPWTSPQRFEHAIDEQPGAKHDGQYDQGTGAPITYP